MYTLKQKDVEGYNWYTTILSSQINDDTLDVSCSEEPLYGDTDDRTGSGKTTTSPIVKESGRSTVSNASNASNAKTGDETDLMLLFSMLGLSLMVILYCRKRKAAR